MGERSSRGMVLAALVVALAGCGSSGKRGPDPNRYVCDEARSFSAEISQGAESVWVTLRNNAFRMDRVETGAGEEYARGRNTLRLEEGVATLDLGDGTRYTNCSRPE